MRLLKLLWLSPSHHDPERSGWRWQASTLGIASLLVFMWSFFESPLLAEPHRDETESRILGALSALEDEYPQVKHSALGVLIELDAVERVREKGVDLVTQLLADDYGRDRVVKFLGLLGEKNQEPRIRELMGGRLDECQGIEALARMGVATGSDAERFRDLFVENHAERLSDVTGEAIGYGENAARQRLTQ